MGQLFSYFDLNAREQGSATAMSRPHIMSAVRSPLASFLLALLLLEAALTALAVHSGSYWVYAVVAMGILLFVCVALITLPAYCRRQALMRAYQQAPSATDTEAAGRKLKPEERKMPLWEQILLYLGTVVGVIFSSAASQLARGDQPTLSLSVATILTSAVIGLVIIPLVYEKLKVKAESPLLVRVGLFVQSGVFWHVVCSAVGKAL